LQPILGSINTLCCGPVRDAVMPKREKNLIQDHVNSKHVTDSKEDRNVYVVQKPILRDLSSQNCPFCGQIPGAAKFVGHICNHLEEISLSAIPRDDEEDEDDEGNPSSRASLSSRIEEMVRASESVGEIEMDNMQADSDNASAALSPLVTTIPNLEKLMEDMEEMVEEMEEVQEEYPLSDEDLELDLEKELEEALAEGGDGSSESEEESEEEVPTKTQVPQPRAEISQHAQHESEDSDDGLEREYPLHERQNNDDLEKELEEALKAAGDDSDSESEESEDEQTRGFRPKRRLITRSQKIRLKLVEQEARRKPLQDNLSKMLLSEEDAPFLKKWILKRLENTYGFPTTRFEFPFTDYPLFDSSDADPDVLADYVLALLRHDGDIDTRRQRCEAEIPYFLKEGSTIFVRDVFDAIHYKSYLPEAPPRIPPATFALAPPTTSYYVSDEDRGEEVHHKPNTQSSGNSPTVPPAVLKPSLSTIQLEKQQEQSEAEPLLFFSAESPPLSTQDDAVGRVDSVAMPPPTTRGSLKRPRAQPATSKATDSDSDDEPMLSSRGRKASNVQSELPDFSLFENKDIYNSKAHLPYPGDFTSSVSESQIPTTPEPDDPLPTVKWFSTSDTPPVAESYTIKCICGYSHDDGSTVFCETCETWQHIQCYYVDLDDANLPDFDHSCADCKPRPLDRKAHMSDNKSVKRTKPSVTGEPRSHLRRAIRRN
jgi:hypothetical protein